ncbi:HlyD family secretion protein [Novosphingobium sp. 9]|uniref:HlyD family secretion protein n=1 Tax=Novosphingobium sp. 9 TaxID=2025349 RepID=UPI0021B51A06|nr:HlyD family secretion protein [Novosphingobium sp. 9]
MTDETQSMDNEPQQTQAADQPAAPKKRMSPRAKVILLVLLVVAVVAALVWFIRYQTYGQYMASTNDAQIDADGVAISPRVNGYVSQLLVADNQDVKKGQPLARIDARDYQAQAAQAQASIAQADASVENVKASIREQDAAIAQAAAQLAAARAQAAHDAGEVARYTPLVASGAETRQQLAQLKLAAAQSADQVCQQSAALEAQKRRIASLQAQIKQADAQADAGKAQLASVKVNLDATLLTAPFDGRVGDRTVQVGQYVQPGTRLMSVVPVHQLYIVANFKETQLALMRPGQPAKISVDALDGLEVDGHVESVSPGTGAQFSILPPQNATGNFTKIVQRVPVRIAIDATPSAAKLLVPGLSVTVTVDTRGAKGDLDRIRQQQKQFEDGKH